MNETTIAHETCKTATGTDEVPSKLLKTAGISIVPSLMTLFKMSATTATLPLEWKLARISAVHKKEDETVRDNYRTLSMLCIPSKLIENKSQQTLQVTSKKTPDF